MANDRLWFVGPGRVELRADGEPPSQPWAGCIHVDVKVGGLCRFDVGLFEGAFPDWLPRAAGHEAVGIVSAVGPGVYGLEVGQPVSLIGEALAEPYFARRVQVPASLVARLPEAPDRPELWIAEPVVCVVNSLTLSPVRAGSRVAVVGAGFMGLLFIQGLRGQPGREVVAIDPLPQRLELARGYGAVPCPIGPDGLTKEQANSLGRFDMVIETAGTQASLDLACNLVAPAGELVLFAWHKSHGGQRSLNLSSFHQRGLRISNNAPISNRHYADLHQATVDLMHRKLYDLQPLMTHVVPFAQAQSLFELAAAGKDGYIKGAMTW